MSLFNPPVRYYIFGVSVSPGYPQPVNATAVIILLSVGCPSFCRGPGAWCNSQTGCFCANGYYSALSGCNVTGNPLQYLACHSFTPPPIEFFEGSVHEFGRLAILLMLLRYLRPFLQYAWSLFVASIQRWIRVPILRIHWLACQLEIRLGQMRHYSMSAWLGSRCKGELLRARRRPSIRQEVLRRTAHQGAVHWSCDCSCDRICYSTGSSREVGKDEETTIRTNQNSWLEKKE